MPIFAIYFANFPRLRVIIRRLEHIRLHHPDVIRVVTNNCCQRCLSNLRKLIERECGWLEEILIPKAITMPKLFVCVINEID